MTADAAHYPLTIGEFARQTRLTAKSLLIRHIHAIIREENSRCS